MFTGLVQGLAKLSAKQKIKEDVRFTFALKLDSPQIGESIAINGTCLTVEQFTANSVQMYASKETLEHSNLGLLNVGAEVNYERALVVGSSIGGHFVSGHIDCLATILEMKEISKSKYIKLEFPREYANYIVDKGSVCLNGISLTVNQCSSNFFDVNVIPETASVTNIKNWQVGDKINLECDMLAKYVQKMLNKQDNQITVEKLTKYGFI